MMTSLVKMLLVLSMRTLGAVASVVVLFTSAPAQAQGVGFLAGGTIDPEQLFVGANFETGELTDNIHLRPGVDGGFGGGQKTASINVDILYKSESSSGWRFVTGGGPAVFITRFDDPSDSPGGIGEKDVSGGLVGLIGFAHDSGLFVEFKFASGGRGPSLKLGAGFKIGPAP